LNRFYGAMTSLDAIVGALSAEGIDVGSATSADLYSRGLDCHNLGGYPQLEKLAGAVVGVDAPRSDDTVLDVGCGLGGPSRFIADRFGCRVVGVDLLPVRIDAARALAEMTRSADRVDYRVADALALPFGDESFAHVWTMDTSIHVRDKAALFGEIARVLQPGGLLVLHDQMGPLPRAMLPAKRAAPYVAPSLPQLIRIVESAGFRLELWRDTTAAVLEFFHDRRRSQPHSTCPRSLVPTGSRHDGAPRCSRGTSKHWRVRLDVPAFSSLAGDSRQKLITRSYSACAVAASTGVPKLLFLPSKSLSVTPRARPQRPQTDIRTCRA
jgi:SAM-dependent methyltransferase